MINTTTQETASDLNRIIDYLMEKRGFDFAGCHPPMLARRIAQRLNATRCRDLRNYLSRLQENASELDQLLNVLTINVIRFFRDTLTFELLACRILPALVLEKTRAQDHSLRVWSAGCAMGEEPYSLAIVIHELLEKEEAAINLHIFATDIDGRVLKDAAEAVYPPTSAFKGAWMNAVRVC